MSTQLLALNSAYKKWLESSMSKENKELLWDSLLSGACGTFFNSEEYQNHTYPILDYYRVVFNDRPFKELFNEYFKLANRIAKKIQKSGSLDASKYENLLVEYKLNQNPFDITTPFFEVVADGYIQGDSRLETVIQNILNSAQNRKDYFNILDPKIEMVKNRELWVSFCLSNLNKLLIALFECSKIKNTPELEQNLKNLLEWERRIYDYFKKEKPKLYHHYLGLYQYHLFNQQKNSPHKVQEIKSGDLLYFGVNYKKNIKISLEDSFLRVLKEPLKKGKK